MSPPFTTSAATTASSSKPISISCDTTAGSATTPSFVEAGGAAPVAGGTAPGYCDEGGAGGGMAPAAGACPHGPAAAGGGCVYGCDVAGCGAAGGPPSPAMLAAIACAIISSSVAAGA
eukprot:CAMPEP_0119496692 /NCGR_PEP_ID=MMETSP1344-20130328/19958_1 /TAXON_ID=236787 /ORGANISM="Florenciella parvula, Strain CCMP2471" /LENGTH=117 /DNA_ID=CAMNT_0007532411 /DNA_START=59 /DNA_END=408 /DNA_ORIENTATION=-